ncbi:MAG: glutamine-hydrolyzing carbamoyl-phosphate synthase small subunit [Clostridia bacterium]|nr:glutamine-hydrolyzing carbamoyl-phosphate synthase small subunit [Clostridia bacterium]
MDKAFDRKIVFENGDEYYGYSFGAVADRVCEIVFNSSVVGYQEIISDLSYANQMVVMTYPLIGNYGVTDEDFEAKVPAVGAIVARDYNDMPSNFRYTKTLSEFMEENDIPGIYGVDTRKLTRSIRDLGTKKALITSADTAKEDAMKILASVDIPENVIEKVSCKKRWYSRTTSHKYNIVAIDCGIKLSIIRSLNAAGCNVTVVPYNTSAEEIEFMKPDGVFVSNGPGNPETATEVIETVKKLIGKYPIFGIAMGHQIISLAYGARIDKMKVGHRGGYPVRNLETGKIECTSQNHGYVVNEESLKNTPLSVTHINVVDGSVEGVCNKKDRVFSVQYNPESAPGPQDSGYLFEEFIKMIKEARDNA